MKLLRRTIYGSKIFLNALRDIEYWKRVGNGSELRKITSLIKSIEETPYTGIGKPEALKYELSGQWSRRIDKKNRIVYSVENNVITVYSLKGHYSKN